VTVADRRVELAPGERLVLGREGDVRVADALCTGYGNVSRAHVELVVTEAALVVRALPSKNGTFLGGMLLQPEVERTVTLPVTLRLAANCYVHVEHIG
jgi:pSer/pThr/pTyr-binding forkhead associated (FHA) protein